MQNCCITCCDSSKFRNSQNITYFSFPLHDDSLMKEWTKEIGCQSPDVKDTSKICSLHFLPEDINYNSNQKIPVLKPSAVPRLYLKESIQSAITKKPPNRLLQMHKNAEFPGIPPIVPNSLTVTSGIIHQLPKVDALLSVPYVSPRFRKILPKLEPIRSKNAHLPENPQPPRTEIPGISPQNPYIIIIPRIENAKPVPNNSRLSNLSKRKAVLRITINKEYNSEDNGPFDLRECQLNEDNGGNSEEIEIKNHKLNRSVVFSLDPSTGEILVTKRDIESSKDLEESPGEDDRRKGEGEGERKEGKEKQGNDVNDFLSLEAAEQLKDLCTKAEQDCSSVKQRLENLREKQKNESAEFEKLQTELASLHAETPVESQQNRGEKRKTEEESSQVDKKKRESTDLNVEDSKSEETLISAAEISISNNGWPNSFSILKHSIKESDSIIEKRFGSLSDTSVALHASTNFDRN